MIFLATRTAGILILGLLLTSTAFAQQQITLDEAVQIALEKNITVQQAQNNLERNEAELMGAYGAFLPNLNLSTSANRSTGQQFNQSLLALDTFTDYSMNSQLSTNVPIFTGWQNISNLRSARVEREASQNDFQRIRENIIFETASEFLQVLLNRELLKIAEENLETSMRQLEQVEAQVEVGMRPIVDLYNQEAVVANNEFDVTQRQNAVNISKLRLIRVLQLDPVADYEFVIPDIETEDIIPVDYNLSELIEAALANRRDLQSQELRLESSEHNLRAARSGYWPTLSFSAGLNTRYSESYRGRVATDQGGIQLVTRSFGDQYFDERVDYGFGLNLSFSIFDRFQTRTNVANRRIDLKNAVLELEDQRSLVYQEVRQAYNDYISYSQQLNSTEKALIAAEKAFETQQERYNVGSTTLIELTTANNEFTNAASNRIQAIYQFIFQEKLLDYYIGRLSEDISF